MKAFKLSLAAGLVSIAAAIPVIAAEISCANVADDRYVTLTYDGAGITCGPAGSTPPPEQEFYTGLGYNFLEKDGDGGVADNNDGGLLNVSGFTLTSGTWSVAGTVENALLVFKFGSNLDPDYISFNLNGILSGTWAVTPVQGGGLSHASLYGTTTTVPTPGTLALLGMGLVAFGALRRVRS
jgi:hypothetical protein